MCKKKKKINSPKQRLKTIQIKLLKKANMINIIIVEIKCIEIIIMTKMIMNLDNTMIEIMIIKIEITSIIKIETMSIAKIEIMRIKKKTTNIKIIIERIMTMIVNTTEKKEEEIMEKKIEKKSIIKKNMIILMEEMTSEEKEFKTERILVK